MHDVLRLACYHAKTLDCAHRRLVDKLDYSTIAFQFMPKEFTLPELQLVYELILDEPLDKRNFRKRILSLDVVKETGEKRKEGAHRPAMLYRLIHPNRVHVIK